MWLYCSPYRLPPILAIYYDYWIVLITLNLITCVAAYKLNTPISNVLISEELIIECGCKFLNTALIIILVSTLYTRISSYHLEDEPGYGKGSGTGSGIFFLYIYIYILYIYLVAEKRGN
jgi:membrane-associated phospholipid phosphatase